MSLRGAHVCSPFAEFCCLRLTLLVPFGKYTSRIDGGCVDTCGVWRKKIGVFSQWAAMPFANYGSSLQASSILVSPSPLRQAFCSGYKLSECTLLQDIRLIIVRALGNLTKGVGESTTLKPWDRNIPSPFYSITPTLLIVYSHQSTLLLVLQSKKKCHYSLLFTETRDLQFKDHSYQPMLPTILELMVRRLFPGQDLAFGLSLFLFTFMFIPTLVVLLAVVVFFLFCYPRLQKSL
ncbi:hypothetical protein BDV12DRAFT_202018 [Aspergillus spectabilis]